MKKQLLSIIVLVFCAPTFAQFTTGTVTLSTSPSMSVKIDTDAANVTLTLIGPNNTWLGIGFGGTSMSSANDMFIWSDATTRDYTSGGRTTPSVDASQSWNIVSDNVVSTTRTVIATRPLASSGDFTFANTSASISVIYAFGVDVSLSYHSGRGSRTLTRSSLGVEDFSLNAAKVYPNPSNGNFIVNSNSAVKKLHVYSQIGLFVKAIEYDGNSNQVEVNLKGLPSGVYLIELQNDADKAWKKIIIE
jgi:hypothetical protein